ncbi:unnamed protein product [Trichogramma brassicae]|uniref:CCHC-type domain-containing protein n=1 Tax=Trichogramma brassicae TaxID=86971 RepID=A0A6H5J5A3_9HYME|nr:unnamed protein product [Trichogramma brassicae]
MPRCPRQILAAVVSRLYWWTAEIADLRRSLACGARRLFQRSRGRYDEETTHSANYASARRLLRVAIKTSKRRCWRQLCDEVDNDVWGKPYKVVMSRLGCPQAKQPSSPLLVRGAVAALFPRVPSGPALRLPRRAEEPIPAVTLEELKGAQSRIKERSAPGPDGIPNSALKIAIAARPDIFLRVYTTCLETGVFPPVWKRQRLVLIPKPGKPPDEPSSYRPLCMLDTAGKILERIICDRLEAFTERPGGLSERQYGFRKGRSTIDAIEDIVSNRPVCSSGAGGGTGGTKKYCAVVTLDVRNAFNSARWDNILAALRRLPVPDYLLRIIASYFSARVLDFTTDDGPESYESPHLEHSCTKASLHSPGGVSPSTSLPACDRRPAARLLRGHICPRWHTTAGPSRGRASAALQPPPPRGRKGRGTLGNAKQVAGSMGPVDEGPMDASTDPKYQNVDREEARRAELHHLTQLLTGQGFFKHHSQRYDHNQSAQCPVCPTSIENAEHVFYHCPRFSGERERLHALLHEVMTPENTTRLMLASEPNWLAVASFAHSKARATHGMSTAVSDGLQSPQGQTSVENPGEPSLMELGPLPTPRTSPYTMVKAITGKIIVAPLHCKEKDARLPSPAEFATGTLEDKLERLDGLIRGLGQFIQGKSNLHKEVTSYQLSLGMALSALEKSLASQEPPRPLAVDKAVCTSPLFSGSATSKRPATSPLASHATPKRHAVTAASKQHDENNNEVGDQDGFVLVDRRRHRQRKQTATTPGAVHARQQPKPRPVQRRAHHRPDAIVIKAKDASKYADILRSLKRSAAGALVLQLKKGVENASDLGEELGKVLGTAATASALLHTSTIEIKDLDECATKEEVTAALDALLGVPVSKRDPVKSLRKAYAGTQVAVVALPDDLAATALKLGHVRIGWVNCRIRAREEAARCYRCWSPGHVAARCKGPDRTELCYRCGQKGHQAKDCKGQPSCVLCRERGADDHRHASTSSSCPLARKMMRTADDENPPAQPQSLRGCPGPALRHHQQAAHRPIWVHRGIPVQERPARVHPYFAWARIGGIFFFSVYAPPRLSEMEFSALLANITEEARGRRPVVIAGDFNAWSTEWGCREARPRASILLDSLALPRCGAA